MPGNKNNSRTPVNYVGIIGTDNRADINQQKLIMTGDLTFLKISLKNGASENVKSLQQAMQEFSLPSSPDNLVIKSERGLESFHAAIVALPVRVTGLWNPGFTAVFSPSQRTSER